MSEDRWAEKGGDVQDSNVGVRQECGEDGFEEVVGKTGGDPDRETSE